MPGVTQFLQKSRSVAAFFSRHMEALGFVLFVIIPLIIRHRRRPVIFSRHSGMGDIICTVPAARLLRDRHPGATFIYNCHPEFAVIPRITGIADRFTCVKAIGQVWFYYRFLFEGFYHFGHGDDFPDRGCWEPMVTEFCRQFGVEPVEEHPALPIGDQARQKVAALLEEKGLGPQDLILIHPGPSWQVREWPHENWNRLVAELRQHGFTNIAQLGAGRHLNRGEVKMPAVEGTVSLVDALTIEECIAMISCARLFVGIDSGLLHIAACTRTPAVGIFGMTLPEYRFSRDFRKPFVVNRIECAGCEHRKPRLHWKTGCPYGIKCMQTLDVGPVLGACVGQLPAHAAPIHHISS